MNPAQLLNPKAFAKEKAKANKKPQNTVAYDPQTLLNPAASRTTQKAPANENGDDSRGFGAGQMIENLNGVTQRDEIPIKKRKSEAIEIPYDDEDQERKKYKATFQKSNGFMTEGLKEDRKKLAAESSTSINAEPIDLTKDDDEVQIIRENINDRVCLGVLHGIANAHRVPAVSQSAMRAFKDHWPRVKVEYNRVVGSKHNMVQLVDRSGTKFATLDLKVAVALCNLLDGAKVTKFEIKMYLADRARDGEQIGEKISKAMKIELILYAPLGYADRIGKFLSQKQLFLSSPVINTGKDVYNPHEPKILGGTIRTGNQSYSSANGGRSVEQILRETSSMFDSLAKDEDLPDMEADSSIITSQLMEHQKKALHFLTDRECSDYDDQDLPPHSLWKFRSQPNGRHAWYHLITDQIVFEKPKCIQGGILADVMGLGKTLSILSLIAATKEEARRFRRQDGPEINGEELMNSKATLIICPKSVLSNWQEQIRNHTANGKLKVYTYHGTSRLQDLDKLSRYDIVLTSYNTAASELHGKLTALMDMNWFRVVLDEAHSIRNSATNISKGCCALNAERRWAITGTPVQNNLYDLGALFKFLHLEPFDHPPTWSQYIMAPFKNGDAKVVEQLQILVRSVTLRRTKITIALPDKKVERVYLDFTSEELQLYKQFAIKANLQLNGITQGGTTLKGKAYAHILKSLGRLRALCAHGREMLSKEDMDEIVGYDPTNAIVLDIGDDDPQGDDCFVTEKAAYDFLNTFFDSEADFCQSCNAQIVPRPDPDREEMSDSEEDDEVPDEGKDLLGHLTPCYHIICTKCTERHEKEVQETLGVDGHHTCPHCQSYVKYDLYPLRKSIMDRLRDERKETQGKAGTKWDEDTYTGPSTKVKELLRELQQSAEESAQLPADEPPIRSVVFSGWTQFLDLIEYALDNAGIGCTRIDGSMSVKQRSQALHTFNTVDTVRVLLVSIKAGGQGLNFTAANKAYVMEPGYNPAAEHQAVDRVHRIGQERDVSIKHFVMRGSVEERVVELQRNKDALANLSMSRKKTKLEDAAQRMAEIRAMFTTKG